MKIITFAMIKYPCPQDFYQPCSCEEPEHLPPQEQSINLAWMAAHSLAVAPSPPGVEHGVT